MIKKVVLVQPLMIFFSLSLLLEFCDKKKQEWKKVERKKRNTNEERRAKTLASAFNWTLIEYLSLMEGGCAFLHAISSFSRLLCFR